MPRRHNTRLAPNSLALFPIASPKFIARAEEELYSDREEVNWEIS